MSKQHRLKRPSLKLPRLSRLSLGLCCALWGVVPTAFALQTSDVIAPQVADTNQQKSLVKASKFMLATANPYATQAGFEVLQAGGNAVDAAIAVQLVLGLVEPQSSGLGGGAIAMVWDNKQKKLYALDGRETAPMGATPTMFLDDKGEPLKFLDAVIGGKSVGTPGTPALLGAMHSTFGSKPWPSLFQSAIVLAENGFTVTDHMAQQVAENAEGLKQFAGTRDYFFTKEGAPLPAGFKRDNPEYAKTLKLFAEKGVQAFYGGELGQAIVDTVTQSPVSQGTLSMADFKRYRVAMRETVCVPYRAHDVCGMGPPTSGGITVGQILGLLRPFDLKGLGPNNPESWRLIGDASRLAFADRGRYIADSDFVPVPTQALINEAYLAERAKLLQDGKRLEKTEPGNPTPNAAAAWADDEPLELPSTSHFVVADAQGNIVSMTTTIENGFGSRLWTRGFLLNNELTDFSFKPEENGAPVANRIEPGKRPRSSMSPTIIFKNGNPYMAIGSPGGSRIINYTAQAIIAHLDWGMDVQQAIAMPHLANRFGDYDVEEKTSAVDMKAGLEALGYKVNVTNMNSGLHGIVYTAEGIQGGADPRRDGTVLGE